LFAPACLTYGDGGSSRLCGADLEPSLLALIDKYHLGGGRKKTRASRKDHDHPDTNGMPRSGHQLSTSTRVTFLWVSRPIRQVDLLGRQTACANGHTRSTRLDHSGTQPEAASVNFSCYPFVRRTTRAAWNRRNRRGHLPNSAGRHFVCLRCASQLREGGTP